MYNIFNKYKSIILFVIKLVIVGGAFYFISYKITTNKTLNNVVFLNRFNEQFLNNYSTIFIVVTFTLLNWFLEIVKWQTLVFTIKSISFFEASKQSLSSLTASLLTPNRIGEYGAKAIYYPKFKRPNVLILNFLGNFSQMIATILFGIIGLTFLGEKLSIPMKTNSLNWVVFVVISFFVFALLFKKYWIKFLIYFKSIPNKIHSKNLFLSIFKYLVFSHQFYFLLVVFGAEINYSIAMPIIFSMYFIASIIPSFVIFDWIIKGSVAVSLFNLYGINEIIILSITSLMWILNFALPSIIGSYFVLTFKPENLILKAERIKS